MLNISFISGIFCWFIAAIIYWNGRVNRRLRDLMLKNLPSTCEDLKALQERLRDLFALGEFHTPAEFSGRIEATELINAPITGKPCVYFYTRVRQIYQNQPDQHKKKKEKKAKTVFCDSAQRNFYLVGEGGRIRLQLPERATFLNKIGLELHPSTFQKTRPDLPFADEVDGDDELLGYEVEEYALVEGTVLYVYGEAGEDRGELVLRQPERSFEFVVTNKSKREYLQQLEKNLKTGAVVSPVLALIGSGLMIWGLW